MRVSYEMIEVTLIPNTSMDKMLIDEVHRGYRIRPLDGYVIHDNEACYTDEFGNYVYRFSSGSCSCGANYDFSATTEKTVTDINGNAVTVTAYGSREFFAFPRELVTDPEYNIYGGGNDTEHEVM